MICGVAPASAMTCPHSRLPSSIAQPSGMVSVHEPVSEPEPKVSPTFIHLLLEILGVDINTMFGQRFERGLRIVISTIGGVGVGLLAFKLGIPEVIGLCIGTAVAGLIFAILKGFDQGPTAA